MFTFTPIKEHLASVRQQNFMVQRMQTICFLYFLYVKMHFTVQFPLTKTLNLPKWWVLCGQTLPKPGWCLSNQKTTKKQHRKYCHFRNPTPDSSVTPTWTPATDFPLNYMQIGNENGKFDIQILQSRVDFYSARANFWMELRNEHRISSWLESSSSTSDRYSVSLVGFLLFCWYFIYTT